MSRRALLGGIAASAVAGAAYADRRLRFRGHAGGAVVADYYVDPSVVSSGNGLSQATAFKYIADLSAVTLTNKTVAFRADGLTHRPASAIPTNLTTANIALSPTAGGATFTTYGSGKATLSGAVLWTGAVGSTTVNGLSCITLGTATEVLPFWFPRVDGVAATPSICAPSGTVGVDSFLTNRFAVDDILSGANGYRFCPAASYGANTDHTKEVSYTGSGASTVIEIRDLFGFWARANAARALSTKDRVVMRLGTNFANYFGTIQSYDPTDSGGVGRVYITTDAIPSNGSTGGFFYALVAHPYGLRLAGQYASAASGLGWIAALPSGGVTDIACYSTIFYFNADDGFSFNSSKTWRFEAIAHGNSGARDGYGILIGSGCDGPILIGALEGHQMRNYNREGAPCGMVDSGAVTSVALTGSVKLTECLGTKILNIAMSTASTGSISVAGPITSVEGGGGTRIGSEGADFEFNDIIITPRARIHDNAGNFYVGTRVAAVNRGVYAGQVNPWAEQWNSANSDADNQRDLTNCWFSGYPNLGATDYITSATIRHDGGGTNSTWDRVFAVGGQQNFMGAGSPAGSNMNTGMRIQRSVLDLLGRTASQTFSGVTLERTVICGTNGTTTLASIASEGGTVTNCVQLAGRFAGVITDEMWDVLTRNDALTGHEDVPWLASPLGLVLPAYGSTRTLVAPVLVHGPLRAGHQADLMFGVIINPNPLATVTLPAGVNDNDNWTLDSLNGINLRPVIDCPDVATQVISLDVNDAGASNGPTQRFDYEITVGDVTTAYTFGT